MSALKLSQPVRLDRGADDLRDLMRHVTEVTEQLHATHRQLQEQVAGLQAELAEANAQLSRSKALACLGEMAAGIAHELRNPLGSIQLYVQMLEEDLAGQPRPAELCAKISRAIAATDHIVRDVLLFARENRIHPAPTSAAELLDRALEGCIGLMERSEIRVCRDRMEEGDVPAMTADAGLLAQALTNILRNAAEAIVESRAAERAVRLSAARRWRRGSDGLRRLGVALTIEDSGPGVEPAVIQRMFNPFFTTRAAGTGLGLAIVHRIVDAHGGDVEVANRAEGGARVTLWLPLDPESHSHSPREANQEHVA